ncbi:MAG: hypothetical protein PHS04_18610 [Tissierellia bacterium]|nr:hypothetical protein [Tissierellia bacterium]
MILKTIETIFFVLLAISAIAFWVNGVTGWKGRGKQKKLIIASIVVFVILGGFSYLLIKI